MLVQFHLYRANDQACESVKTQEHVLFRVHFLFRRKTDGDKRVRYPPRSGWLDELDRLKGGWSWV